MSEFSDRPLIADSITGLRSFKIDKLGRLTGVSFMAVFKPGVNVAKCAHQKGNTTRSASTVSFVSGGSGGGGVATTSSVQREITRALTQMQAQLGSVSTQTWQSVVARAAGAAAAAPAVSAKPVSLVKKPRHQVANVNCTCGYYAYFDEGSNPYHGTDQVHGIVRGAGTVTVGSRGFRAEKTELVALVEPRSVDYERPGDALAAKLYRFGTALIYFAAVFGVGGLVGGLLTLTSGSTSWAAVPQFLGLPVAAMLLYLSFRSITVHYDKHYDDTLRNQPDADVFALIHRNYPDVPVYRSLKLALADHPLNPPPPVVAPSPDNDPEFWTRAVA